MKAMMKKIAIGAAAAAMAMSAVGMTASAAEKHPGESGYCYNELQNDIYTGPFEDQPGRISDDGIMLGKRPGDAGYEAAKDVCEFIDTLPYDDLKGKVLDAYFLNGFVCGNFLDAIKDQVAERQQAQNEKNPGESGCNYEAMQNGFVKNGKHPGESGYCYEENELGYDPSKYTDEQIKLIEASRDMNGFVCGSLLMQFDEENAAEKAEEKPQHAFGLKVAGDVDCDGCVDVSDSVLLCRVIAEEQGIVLTAQGNINADVNGDGILTLEDNKALLALIAEN